MQKWSWLYFEETKAKKPDRRAKRFRFRCSPLSQVHTLLLPLLHCSKTHLAHSLCKIICHIIKYLSEKDISILLLGLLMTHHYKSPWQQLIKMKATNQVIKVR